MSFSITSRDPATLKTDLLVISVTQGKTSPVVTRLDKKMGGSLSRQLKKEKFEGKSGQSKLVNTNGRLPAEYILIVGMGETKKFETETIRKAAGKALRTAKQIRAGRVVLVLPAGVSAEGNELTGAAVEGFSLASYHFGRYKKDKNAHDVKELLLSLPDKKGGAKKGIHTGALLAEGVKLARDLINTPARDMAPLDLARVARSLKGVRTRILTLPQIRRLKMGAYLGVAQGSINPPAFLEMHYRPRSPKKRVVLVGKGVTFDSGGLSLKPPKSMETMKDDMSGAAAVIGLMSVIARLAPSVEVWGMVAAAENMPDAMAQRPGDIVTAMNGKTIEVLNTDAEGRLTLADAVFYAGKKKPDYIVDAATLTGACLVALGERISGIMGNDPELVNQLIHAGKKTGEKIWELPLAEEYKDELLSPIADLKNVGGNWGGTINGGLFIQEFVGKNKWAHIDIAGPSWTDHPSDYESRGGTGVMVRTFYEFLSRI